LFPVHLEKFPHAHVYTYIFYHCLIWFIFHYYYYLRVLKSSLYLSSRPLVSIRVAANTHVHALVEFNDLWYLTICSTIVISFYLEYMNASPPSILFFQRFIVIWCALCHMYMYMCIYKGFFCHRLLLLLLSIWLNMSEGHTSTVCPIITFCWSSYCSKRNQIRNTFLWHDIVK